MPGPTVYVVVVAVVGAVAVGFALKELVFDPYVTPQFTQWREERRARNEERRRRRQPAPPHFTHEASPVRSRASTHEMQDMGLSGSRGDSINVPLSSGLRLRRSNAGVSNVEGSTVQAPGPMDAPSGDNIPYTPLAPERNPWTDPQSSRSSTLSPSPSRSPFELGSESATLPSTSPRIDDLSLGSSRASSPRIISPPRIQLPTPSESVSEDNAVPRPGSPETHPDLLEWSAVESVSSHSGHSAPASELQQSQTLLLDPHSDVHASAMSRTVTDTSASFMTAQSPSTEFRSFPPSALTSPFSETFALSGEEDMYSLPSHVSSSESLPVFAAPEDDGRDGLTFVVGNTAEHRGDSHFDDSLSDDGSAGSGSSGGFSDESWSEFGEPSHDGATSPRH
ncbi:uncharacterized protein FOMMEDRAFT_22093 [Fomitiporia mediterranea MF3/22]|uniref:uncharacterized protein n=1 Tax=Fomitiporia mediterranea (strain MF3/22) TaxID=694068 RepID=UPI0004408BE3|nr:uncharacterized protein FOMMEDRAFT_22093 [Fomitiporia mediterranea MF3/22]EJD01745.1 hypothetical protein FOMMEDRAFT_22093 [Fomitiporia mediterranea MF3/22]